MRKAAGVPGAATVALLAAIAGCERGRDDGAAPASADPPETPTAEHSVSGKGPGLGALVRATVADAAASAEAFIPPAATSVIVLDIAQLTKSEVLLRAVETFVTSTLDGDDKRDYDDLAQCGLDLEKIRRAVLATDSDHTALTLQGPRLGDLSLYRCFLERAEARGNPDEFEISTDGRYPKLKLEDGDIGYLVGSETLIIAEEPWATLLATALEPQGRRLRQPTQTIAAMMSLTDTEAALWWVSGASGADIGLGGFGVITSFRGQVILADHLRASTWLETTSPKDAESTRRQIQEQFDAMKGVLPTAGLSGELVESITIATDADAVRIDVEIKDDDIRAMASALGASL